MRGSRAASVSGQPQKWRDGQRESTSAGASGRTRILFASVAFATVPGLAARLGQRYIVKTVTLWLPGRNRAFSGKLGLGIAAVIHFIRLLRCPAAYDPRTPLITDSAHYPCLLLARTLSLFGMQKNVYLFNFYIHRMGNRRYVRRILRWLIGSNVSIMTQSSSERDYFLDLAPTADIRYFPYCRGPIEAVDANAIQFGNYVFAGGYTNRDYAILIAAARALPDVPFVLVSSRLNRISEAIPPNILHLQDVDLRQFQNLLAGCRLVVIPLKENVGSSGQMVALAGMQFAKSVIYPDFDVVAQYFVNGVSGVSYVAGSAESLRETIRQLYPDRDRLLAIGARARQRWATHFTMARFESALSEHIDEVLERSHQRVH